MIIFGIAFLILGLLILPIAWRGRVSARGEFCRKCNFDLAGSPIDTDGNKCPECGQPIHTQSSRRTTLRRSSRPGLIVVAFLLLAGLTTTGIGITGNSAAVYAKMPDGIIVGLFTIGSDGAFDELVNRLTRVPPLSDAHWDRLIDYALKIQADPQAPWEPVLGELLSDAWVSGRLTDEQVNQYLDHAMDIKYLIRDRVHYGSSEIQFQVRITPGRIHSINGIDSGFLLNVGIINSTVGNEPPRQYRPDGIPLTISSSGINIPKVNSNWSYASAVKIQPIETTINAPPGTELPVIVKLDFSLVPSPASLSNMNESSRHYKAVTINRTIKILEEGTPLVETISDLLSIKKLKEHYRISEVRMVEELDPKRASWTPILGFSMMSTAGFPDPLAFRVYLRVVDGDVTHEIEIGKAIHEQTSGDGAFGSSVTWTVGLENHKESKQAADFMALIKKHGKVDVVYRSDPQIAENNPTIDHILDATLIFRDVPIRLVENYTGIWRLFKDPKWRASDDE